MADSISQIRVIDTHTGGEPTRVIVAGGPALGGGPLPERRARFAQEFDSFRSAIVNEPRGSDVMVGALLCEPLESTSAAAVIYFNNVGYLGMCGHGTIGLVIALAHLGRIKPGSQRIETPVGTITVEWEGGEFVSLENVASYRYRKAVEVEVPEIGIVTGDIAWGGNWFFLVHEEDLEIHVARASELTHRAMAIRRALERHNITGADGGEIDHIELMTKSPTPGLDGRNFVLCPGGAWDRSPCGTGTSAKVACLAADGLLQPGEVWKQESTLGSVFEASYRVTADGSIIPRLRGTAWVNAETTVLLNPRDPFCWGVRSSA